MAQTDPNPATPPSAVLLEEVTAAFPQLQILEYVGGGGMGRVFKARQAALDRMVALKVLPPELSRDPAFAERFVREGRALARLQHPNIVTIYDFGQTEKFCYLIMEYVDGVNLRQAMRSGLPPREALAIVPKICEALQYAHDQGVLHRDIKPENILLDTRGQIKIADFGVAKLGGEIQQVTLTVSGSALGTPHYMAPEQIEHPQEVDHRADIYSLGVVFYEMLTGGLPIGRFPAPSEKSGTDPRLDQVVFRTLEKERERRYQSAGEVKSQVEFVTSHGLPATVPRPPGLVASPGGPLSSKAVVSMVLSLLSVLLVLPWMITVRSSKVVHSQQVESASMSDANTELLAAELKALEAQTGGAEEDAALEARKERVRQRLDVMRSQGAVHPAQITGPSFPAAAMITLGLQLACLVAGMVLGFSALGDIRRSGGVMRGVIPAIIGASLVPSLAIFGAAGAVFVVIKDTFHVFGQNSDFLLLAMLGAGVWLDFLLVRRLYRSATCWTPPAVAETSKHAPLGVMALWFSVAGTACLMISVLKTNRIQIPQGMTLVSHDPVLPWVALGLLISSVVLGFRSGSDPRGKFARILSSIMIALYLGLLS